jgi:hypothetical protein
MTTGYRLRASFPNKGYRYLVHRWATAASYWDTTASREKAYTCSLPDAERLCGIVAPPPGSNGWAIVAVDNSNTQ